MLEFAKDRCQDNYISSHKKYKWTLNLVRFEDGEELKTQMQIRLIKLNQGANDETNEEICVQFMHLDGDRNDFNSYYNEIVKNVLTLKQPERLDEYGASLVYEDIDQGKADD